MIKNFYFVVNEENGEFELWVDGECITECFGLKNCGDADLMEQLVEFANVPCYKKLSVEKVKAIVGM